MTVMKTKSGERFAKAGLTNPTPGDVHVNTALSTFAQKYLQSEDAFVSLRAFPNLPVQHNADQYYVFDKSDFYRDEVEERADGSESAGTQFRLSQDAYIARVRAVHKDVGDQTRANADAVVNLMQSATELVTHKLMINREIAFSNTFMNASSWPGNTGAPANLWDTVAGDPIVDVRDKKRLIQSTTGFRPNRMVLGRPVYDRLLDNAAIQDRISGGATVETPAMVMRQKLAEILELDEILVLDSIYTTDPRGAADPTYQFHGADQALLYFAPQAVSAQGTPSAGVSFSWVGMFGMSNAGMRIRKFRMEEYASDRVEGEMAYDYKVTGPELGYLFTGAVTLP